ncbi:MAG: alpha/beta fold hydrolase [Acidimicrobiia bacterium]
MPLRAFGPIFGQVYGDGDPGIVALHGWARRGADFDRVLDGLDAVAFDLPGFGASPAPTVATGAAGYAAAVVEALDVVGGGPFVLVGHSFGGRVAVVIASTRPELVKGVVLSGVPLIRRGSAAGPSLGYRLMRRANRIGLVSDERMERERRSRGSADYRAASGVMRDVLVTVVNESYENELGGISCPVALVWGADDTDVPVAVAEAARELLSEAGVDVTLEVVADVGHFTPTLAPAALRAAIERVS